MQINYEMVYNAHVRQLTVSLITGTVWLNVLEPIGHYLT